MKVDYITVGLLDYKYRL